MAKVLFFNIPAYGHTNPTLPLIAELNHRGEHVIYYSSEAFRSAIEQAGATFRSIDAFFNERTYVDDNLVRFGFTLIRATQEIIPAILTDVTADKAEDILTQPAFQQASATIGASSRQTGGPSLAVDEIEAFKHRQGI